MKKKIALYIIVISLVIAIMAMMSCTNNKITENNSSIDQYKEAGEMHNQGLEYTYNKLLKMYKKNLTFKKEELERIFINEIKEFSENKIEGYNELNNNYGISVENYINIISNSTKDTYLDSILNNSDLDQLQIEYINRIIDLSNEFGNILSELQDSLGVINSEIINEIELDDNEKLLLLASTSVTESSYEYWDENFYDWLTIICNLFGVDIDSLEDVENLSDEIWKEDIKGGIIGGITGGATSGGSGIIPGAVIGAFSLSAYEALTFIFNLF